jgi:hypothetical protein
MKVIPKNIEEAFAELDRMLQQDDKDYIVENGSIAVHHSLGRWIRNNWELWDDEANDLKRIFTEIGISHPDDMSNYIIKWYIHHLKNDDDFYKKEIKIIKERHNENVIDPSTSLNILTRIASALIGPDITPVKAMTEEESKEWHKYHSKTLENGDMIISDDIINMPADEAKALCDKCIPAINKLELEKSFWNEKDLAEEAGVTEKEAKYIIKSMNL